MKSQIIYTDSQLQVATTDCELTNFIVDNFELIIQGKEKETTQQTYRNNGTWFKDYLVSQGGFQVNTLPLFVRFIKKSSKSQSTQASRCVAAKFILKQVNIINDSVLPDYIYGKLMKFQGWVNSPTKSTKEGQSIGEMEHIKDWIEQLEDGGERTLRKAQFALLAMQGLRASEAARLTFEDFSFSHKIKTVKVTRKGGHEEKVKLFDASVRLIKSYLSFHGIEKGFLFEMVKRGEKTGKPITRQYLSVQWKKIFKEIGLGKYTIHDFRHSLGTTLAAETGNAFAVKSVLGHRSLTTSQRYVDDEAYKKIHLELDKNVNY